MEEFIEVKPKYYTLKEGHPVFEALQKKLGAFREMNARKNKKLVYDVASITENPKLFQSVVDWLTERYRAMGSEGPTHILGIDSCGCYIAAPLALSLGISFVPMRRGSLTESDFVKEGGAQKAPDPPLFVRHKSISSESRVVLIDDFIATGHTLESALDCVQVVGSKVLESVVICEIAELNGVAHVHSVPKYINLPIISLFRLHKASDVLFTPRRFQSKL